MAAPLLFVLAFIDSMNIYATFVFELTDFQN